MEGDKVYINASVTEHNGMPVFGTEIAEKPQFMLDEEYSQQLIRCAVLAVKMACSTVFPNNIEMQSKIARSIAENAIEKD